MALGVILTSDEAVRSVISYYGWRAVRSRTGRSGPRRSPGRIRAAATVKGDRDSGGRRIWRDHGTGGYGAVARATSPGHGGTLEVEVAA